MHTPSGRRRLARSHRLPPACSGNEIRARTCALQGTSSRKVPREFRERCLDQDDIVAIFIDGKCFANDEMVIVFGVTFEGHKKVLGFVQTGTENSAVISDFVAVLD